MNIKGFLEKWDTTKKSFESTQRDISDIAVATYLILNEIEKSKISIEKDAQDRFKLLGELIGNDMKVIKEKLGIS
ncbi:MAG: hypothetical protein MUC49_04375 [Raineya sp.]|jgi:hypothetical protein|nr:hypothetical protein [Raineya sp.]